MAKLVGLLMGVKDPGKVPNRRVPKSRIVLIPILLILILLIINVDKTLILGLPQKQNGCSIYASIVYISIYPLKHTVRHL